MASARILSLRAVNRALLSRQLLLERQVLPAGQADPAARVVQVIEHLMGLQAQAPFPPYYGLHSRLDGFRPEDLATLITDRSVVIDFRVDSREMCFPMVPAGASNDDIIVGPEGLKPVNDPAEAPVA